MLFFPGWHNINNGSSGVKDFLRVCISLNRLRKRKAPINIQDWIIDNGAFHLLISGGTHYPVEDVVKILRFFGSCGRLRGFISQDWLCQPEILQVTGLSVQESQILTIGRYDQLLSALDGFPYLIPVIQGQSSDDYLRHLEQYNQRIKPGAWVAVGGLKGHSPQEVEDILLKIKLVRRDLRLHGCGLGSRLLKGNILGLLYSADSSSAGLQGGSGWLKYKDQHDPHRAIAYAANIESRPVQSNCNYLQSGLRSE